MKLIDGILEFVGLKDSAGDRQVADNRIVPETVYDAGQNRNPTPPNRRFIGRKPENGPTTVPVSSNASVVMIEPATFDDAQHIADYIKSFHTVVVNFEYADRETTRRMTDFISGVTYALSGNIQKVSRNIMLCTPHNVDVASEIDEIALFEDK